MVSLGRQAPRETANGADQLVRVPKAAGVARLLVYRYRDYECHH